MVKLIRVKRRLDRRRMAESYGRMSTWLAQVRPTPQII